MIQLNINTLEVVKYTNKLESLNKTGIPTAVRNTLNTVAFDVKTNTMPAIAKKEFEERKPNFFKANSKVQKATGTNIATMKSIVGFVSAKHNQAVEDLNQQEHGGVIDGRSLITTKQARTGNDWSKSVKPTNRVRNITNVINAEKVKLPKNVKGKAQRFVRAAIMAKKLNGKNAFVLGNKWGGGNQTLSRIDRVVINKKKRTIKFKRTPIYTYRKGRKISVARTNFMQRASMESGLSLERTYQNEAIKQVKKLMR